MKRVAILGSTGSIGQNAFAVIKRCPDEFQVVALSANSNIERLSRQIKNYQPQAVCVVDERYALQLESQLGSKTKIISGADTVCAASFTRMAMKLKRTADMNIARGPFI